MVHAFISVEFEATLIYIASSRITRLCRKTLSQTKTETNIKGGGVRKFEVMPSEEKTGSVVSCRLWKLCFGLAAGLAVNRLMSVAWQD